MAQAFFAAGFAVAAEVGGPHEAWRLSRGLIDIASVRAAGFLAVIEQDNERGAS